MDDLDRGEDDDYGEVNHDDKEDDDNMGELIFSRLLMSSPQAFLMTMMMISHERMILILMW